VLAAGAGTRLRPLTDALPKALAPLLGRPVAARLLEQLEPLGLDAVAMNLHHGGDLVERVLGPAPVYLRERWLRGTAGALAGAHEFLRAGSDFLVVSADGAHDVDLGALVVRHRQSGAAATVTVKRIARPETCAIVELDAGAIVRRFVEKPAAGEVFTDLASIGIYCFRADVLDAIPSDRAFDIAGELIPLLLGRGDPIAAYETDAWWSDVGDPAGLLAANLELAGDRDARVLPGCEIAADARLDAPAVVGPHARVGRGAVVRRALVLPGAEVAAGAVVEDAIHGTGDDVLRTWLR
jgi:mannose-1-phosphate guanylyltransferase/mannose-1-phosphate guanylyltransferase/phosphomannomutase